IRAASRGGSWVKDSPARRVASRRTLLSMRSYCGISLAGRPAIGPLAPAPSAPLMPAPIVGPVTYAPVGEPTIGSRNDCAVDRAHGGDRPDLRWPNLDHPAPGVPTAAPPCPDG